MPGDLEPADREAAIRELSERIAAVQAARVQPVSVGTAPADTAPAGSVSAGGVSAGSEQADNADSAATAAAAAASAGSAGSAGSDAAARPVPPPDPVLDTEEGRRAKDIVVRQLAMAPRPRATLARKLAQREVSEQVSTAVLDRFEVLGLIDDRAYAEAYVRAKHRDRGLGRRGLRAELRRQGVADGDFTDAVNEVDDGAERERAAELVGKRIDAAMAAGPVAARRRLLGQLARRGYPPDLAARVVNDAIERHQAGSHAGARASTAASSDRPAVKRALGRQGHRS